MTSTPILEELALHAGSEVDAGALRISSTELVHVYPRSIMRRGRQRYISAVVPGRSTSTSLLPRASLRRRKCLKATPSGQTASTAPRSSGVVLDSLAPRFVGNFEKGIEYRGDLGAFASEYLRHAAIASAMGPYKISVHSGSDKFAVYKVLGRTPEFPVHIKTAGTSYLEALRTIATVDGKLFREILSFALDRFDEEKASYHVSAQRDE